jgi:hypothetical protein
MSAGSASKDDWTSDVAERIVGDIPHAVFMAWAVEVPERVALMLRTELRNPSSGRELNAFEEIVRALPDYLPEQTAARLRAKLLGPLLTAGALGQDFLCPGRRRRSPLANPVTAQSIREKADP